MKKYNTDIFNVKWKLPKDGLCPICGQPDSCGDCTHQQLSKKEVKDLGGILSSPSQKLYSSINK